MRNLYFIVILLFACPVLQGQDSARLYLEQGLKWKESGQCEKALPLFQKSVQADPKNADAFIELAWCYNELGQYELALNNLGEASRLRPADKRLFYESGFAYLNLDSIDLAEKNFRKSLALDSSYQLARMGLGDVYRDKKEDPSSAVRWYTSVADLDIRNKKAQYWSGWCYNELKNFKSAIPYLKNVIATDSTDRLAYSELGYSSYSLGNYTEAISYLKKTETLPGPRIETATYYLGLCYVQVRQKQEAIKKYNELVLMGSELATGLLAEIRGMND